MMIPSSQSHPPKTPAAHSARAGVVIRRLLRRGGLRHRELAVGAVRARHELRVRPDLDDAPALQHLRPNMSDSRHCLPIPLERNGFRAGRTGVPAGAGAHHDAIGVLDGG